MPQFWPNLFYKIAFIILGLSLLSTKAFTSENNYPNILGFIEGLEKLSTIKDSQYTEWNLKNSQIETINQLPSDVNDFKIHPITLKAILFNSDVKYSALFNKDECRFYSLLENDLIKISDDSKALIPIIFYKKDGLEVTAKISIEHFFTELYKRKCFNNKEYKTLFNIDNYKKTIDGIKFSTPKGPSDCLMIHNEWLLNSFTPYLCKISRIIANDLKGPYKLKTTFFQENYIETLCENLDHPDIFCAHYLKSDYWNKAITGEAPRYAFYYRCKNILQKSILEPNDLKDCSEKFLKDDNICLTKGSKDHPAFYPMQTCSTLSKTLAASKLIYEYQDCPGNLEIESITNIHRIVNHFFPQKISDERGACSSEANNSFAKIAFNEKRPEIWPLKICFLNRIENKENCTPYVLGDSELNPLSETKVISKILYQNKGTSPKLKCEITPQSKFNPNRSEFKTGCFLVYNEKTCNSYLCPKKVILDEKDQGDIHYIGNLTIDYFSSDALNEKLSLAKMLEDKKFLQNRPLKNLTEVISFLDKTPNGIIHGAGCIEDLRPEFNFRKSINQCHPTPFIIDGHLRVDANDMLVTHLATDDINTPLSLTWNIIFNSVSSYRAQHPLNQWMLYGLKK